jgi:hypothetical protein
MQLLVLSLISFFIHYYFYIDKRAGSWTGIGGVAVSEFDADHKPLFWQYYFAMRDWCWPCRKGIVMLLIISSVCCSSCMVMSFVWFCKHGMQDYHVSNTLNYSWFCLLDKAWRMSSMSKFIVDLLCTSCYESSFVYYLVFPEIDLKQLLVGLYMLMSISWWVHVMLLSLSCYLIALSSLVCCEPIKSLFFEMGMPQPLHQLRLTY